MASTSELTSRLQDVGLGSRIDFWLELLKSEGVESLASLKHLERDTEIYSKFEEKAKNKVENKALAVLLKINDETEGENESRHQEQNVLLKPSSCSISVEKHAKLLMEKLQLSKYYDTKLKLHIKDALMIRLEPLEQSLMKRPVSDLKQLPFLVLHKLMSFDFLCMTDLVVSKNHNESLGDSDDSDSEPDSNSSLKGIHPVDCLISLLMSCDSFLCQDLYSRLSKCQLAIPLLLPNPSTKQLMFPLWEMESIILDWKTLNSNNKVKQHTVPMIDNPMPIVSFIRIGEPQKYGQSKSGILNDVIGERHHDYFFHRDCPGGHYSRYLGDGLVDMFWYLPSGQTNDTFISPIVFLNLHGDARNHSTQIKLLSNISSMCFIIVADDKVELDSQAIATIQKFYSKCGLTVLSCLHDVPSIFGTTFPNAPVKDLRRKNAVQIKNSVRRRIKANEKSFKNLKKVSDIQHDINDLPLKMGNVCPEYHAGWHLSQNIMTTVRAHKQDKDKLLPLQGKYLWRAWAIEDKEYYRQSQIGNELVNIYTTKVKKKKIEIRQKQLKQMNPMTPLMTMFTKSLLEVRGPTNFKKRNFFLQSLKLQLNDLSTSKNFEKQNQYSLLRSKMLNDEKLDECKEVEGGVDLKKQLKSLQDDMIECSFGLEHFFREVGQMYEASHAVHQHESYSYLPEIAAELLIDGYPLEVMDGDACHVPLQWVQAVLTIAVEKLRNPKVFVLSVLGLQSSGKSTMLNTTFGLQLNVSAGRCTRGAFMQLVPLDEESVQKTGCSFILIIDTEGLRAPHLVDPIEAQKHDNELATFVIGLANLALININGEVAGDMDNILQTAVHAFLRMKEIKFKPSCQLIHQNAVIDVRNTVGQDAFLEKLDKFTAIAAQEENCAGKYRCFSDVIHFNAATDIHHFPGLWEGSPPMATVNQGYSRSAQELKYKILDIIGEAAQEKHSASEQRFCLLHLDHFKQRIEDMWRSLLREDFVFSFRNSIEVTAFNKLEKTYYELECTFKEEMSQWEHRAKNAILHIPIPQISLKYDELLKNLKILVLKWLKKRKDKMETYFSGSDKDVIAHWKAKFERKLLNLSIELENHAERLCTRLHQSRLTISSFEEIRVKNIGYIKQVVQEHIRGIKKEHESLQKSIVQKRLKRDQREKLLQSDLFSHEKLRRYKEMDIISETQVIKLSEIMESSGNQLTTKSLDLILFGGVIEQKEITKILKRVEQPDDVLRAEFDKIWDAQIKDLPESIPSLSLSVQKQVEKSLLDFVGESNRSTVTTKLSSKDLITWGKSFQQHRTSELGFGRMKQWFLRSTNHKGELMELIIKSVSIFLNEKTEENIGFNSIYTEDLLRNVKGIKIKYDPGDAIFDRDYIYELYLMACGCAIPKFEQMAQSFEEQNDPKVYLEKREKIPLFIKFKNLYKLSKAEEVIADTLCAYVTEPIREQVRNTLGDTIVGKMMKSERYFFNAMEFKVKVLIDLHEQNNFLSYMSYLRNAKEYLKAKLRYYTKKYCNCQVHEFTRLQKAAANEVHMLIGVMQNAVDEVDNNKTDIKDWMEAFCDDENILNELGVDLRDRDLLEDYESLKELNVANFKKEIGNSLKDLTKKLEEHFHNIEYSMLDWSSANQMLDSLIGCTAQCPFCGEQCDRLEEHKEEIEHQTAVHRMDCLRGWRWKSSKVLTTDFCPALVCSDLKFSVREKEYHPYKQYKTIHKDWIISPDSTSDGSLYWKSFVGKFKNELAKEYDAYPPKVPPEWSEIEWKEVKRNLEKLYNVRIN